MSSTTRDEERKAAGSRIDPATAEVWFEYAQVVDPYGDERELPAELYCVGRMWFAADPSERIAVSFYDLPKATCASLQEQRRVADREGWARIHSKRCHANRRLPELRLA